MAEFVTCPQCGALAEVLERHVLGSTDGPMEHLKIRCVQRHWFFMSAASLERCHAQLAAAPTPPPAARRA